MVSTIVISGMVLLVLLVIVPELLNWKLWIQTLTYNFLQSGRRDQ